MEYRRAVLDLPLLCRPPHRERRVGAQSRTVAGKFVAVTSTTANPAGRQVATSADGVNRTAQDALATNNNWDGITAADSL